MSLQKLKVLDELTEITFVKCPCYFHKEHRFTLPIVHFAQQEGILPKPCTLVLFDAHHDALEPYSKEAIIQIRENGIGLDEFIDFCDKRLSSQDDDWVKAGMELGMFDDVVIFGADKNSPPPYLERGNKFQDHTGQTHRVEIRPKYIGDSLESQGDLSDLVRRTELSELWEILGWQFIPKKRFEFTETDKKILIDIDLDFFTMEWSDFIFPWPNEVFKKKFYKPSDYSSTKGWTGKMFFDGLLNKAGLITVAREPDCCGGEKKAKKIFKKLNRYFFDNQLIR